MGGAARANTRPITRMRTRSRFIRLSPMRTPYRNGPALSIALRRPCVWAACVVLLTAFAAGCDSPTAPGATIRYAALGASDAVGIGASPEAQGYVFQLSRRLNGARHGGSLRNLGILGALVDQIADRELEPAIAFNPG